MTKRGQKLLFVICVQCIREDSMTVRDNTIQAEGLGEFYKIYENLLQKKLKNWFQMWRHILENQWELDENLIPLFLKVLRQF